MLTSILAAVKAARVRPARGESGRVGPEGDGDRRSEDRAGGTGRRHGFSLLAPQWARFSSPQHFAAGTALHT